MEARGKQVIRGRMRSYCGLIFSLFLLPLQISLSLIITTEGCLQTGRLLVICLLSETKHVPSFSRKRPPRSASFFSKPFSFLSLFFLATAITGTKLRNFCIFIASMTLARPPSSPGPFYSKSRGIEIWNRSNPWTVHASCTRSYTRSGYTRPI